MRRWACLIPLLLAGCDRGNPTPAVAHTEAQRLLAEAGFPGGKGFPKLTVLYNTSESHKQIAAAIQESWRKILGMEVELANTVW